MTKEDAVKLLDETAAKLGEHFGSVQIMVSWNEEGFTKGLNRGCGDWYARQGLAHEFINQDMAQETAHQIAEKLKDPPDDWRAMT